MITLPCHSKAARDAGLPARFLYWQGHSRRRYLFTRTSLHTLSDFDEGVVIAVRGGEVVWTGEVSDLAAMPLDAEPARGEIYLHLLAVGAAERKSVIDDFRPFGPLPLAMAA